MIHHKKFVGAAPVGQMSELPLVELSAITYFRMIATSTETRTMLHRDFAQAFGAEHGKYYAYQFELFFNLLVKNSRRQIMRHDIDCTCFGGDESAVANIISLAARGDLEEAELLASNLMACKAAKKLIAPAEEVGLALHLMLERFPLPVLSKINASRTKH